MPRIAVVNQGDPTVPGAWSGVLAGLMAGLAAVGCEVVPINAELVVAAPIARRLRMSWTDRAASRVYSAASSLVASTRLARTPELDGVVMIGSGYTLSGETPVVTFEDMTLAQALERSDPAYDELSPAGARRWRERQRQIYERAQSCCVASEWAGDSIHADYGIPRSRIEVVGFGANIAAAAGVERDWNVPRFLWIGVDWQRKRGADVVEAFAAVRDRYPKAELHLVGRHPVIDAPGLNGHGYLPVGSADGRAQLAELLGRATCLVMPSTYEPFGIAHLDAAASGAPSIGTTVGGAAEAIGAAGRAVDPDDPRALQAAMLELADPATARRLGALAIERSEQFTWEAVGGRVRDALGLDGSAQSPSSGPRSALSLRSAR